MQWYVKVFQNYAVFQGRARRKEYWMFALINLVISFVLAFLGRLIESINILMGIYSLVILLPSLAVSVRRLHDTGRSGWWVLIGLIPLIGGIIFLIFTCQDSEADNQYGPNPKLLEHAESRI